VCVWPSAAKGLKLSSNTWSNTLPSVLMFEKGREWGRLPSEAVAGDPSKRNYYTRVGSGWGGGGWRGSGERRLGLGEACLGLAGLC
jgi:hypothetical protein